MKVGAPQQHQSPQGIYSTTPSTAYLPLTSTTAFDVSARLHESRRISLIHALAQNIDVSQVQSKWVNGIE
jgi:hypothetical protein